jgi:spore coat polysaccharide biosynthesis protein SpsF
LKFVATIEARMTSSRLPGKVLAPLGGKPALEVMVERLRKIPSIREIVVATTSNKTDDPVQDLAERLGVGFWRGSEDDVLQRVLDAANAYEADVIVEFTGDCPLIDPEIAGRVIETYRSAGADYVSNVMKRSYPMGMETQVFARRILEDVARRTQDKDDHEHVSLFIYRNPQIYSLRNVEAPPLLTRPDLRLTLDTKEDLAVISALYEALSPRSPVFSLAEMLAFLDANPEIAAINSAVAHRHV